MIKLSLVPVSFILRQKSLVGVRFDTKSFIDLEIKRYSKYTTKARREGGGGGRSLCFSVSYHSPIQHVQNSSV
jgi:hypothetical protein